MNLLSLFKFDRPLMNGHDLVSLMEKRKEQTYPLILDKLIKTLVRSCEKDIKRTIRNKFDTNSSSFEGVAYYKSEHYSFLVSQEITIYKVLKNHFEPYGYHVQFPQINDNYCRVYLSLPKKEK